jgi:hypothetical protein
MTFRRWVKYSLWAGSIFLFLIVLIVGGLLCLEFFPTNRFHSRDEVKTWGYQRLVRECHRIGASPEEYTLDWFEFFPDDPQFWGTRDENYKLAYRHVSQQRCMTITLSVERDGVTFVNNTPREYYYGKHRPVETNYCFQYLRKNGHLSETGKFTDGVDGTSEYYYMPQAEQLENQ